MKNVLCAVFCFALLGTVSKTQAAATCFSTWNNNTALTPNDNGTFTALRGYLLSQYVAPYNVRFNCRAVSGATGSYFCKSLDGRLYYDITNFQQVRESDTGIVKQHAVITGSINGSAPWTVTYAIFDINNHDVGGWQFSSDNNQPNNGVFYNFRGDHGDYNFKFCDNIKIVGW